MFGLSPALLLAAALALSVAGNAALAWAWRAAHDDAVAIEQQRLFAQDAANSCSKSVQKLAGLGIERARRAGVARAAAAASAASGDRRADLILAAAPSVPGDDCKSAQAQISTWLAGRKP